MIIDDEPSVRESLASFFSDEGYRVLRAEDGRSGLDLFFKDQIDVVITDLKMPQKNGIQVMDEISTRSPETPMIVISGYGEKKDIIAALRMGAKDYITKPIEDLDMVHHVIRKVLENKYLTEENRRYRIRLEKSEARYRTITEQVAEGVFTVDEHENITFTNPAFCRMLGYSSRALLNKNLEELTPQKSFRIVREQTLVRREGKTSRYEIQMIDCGKNPVHIELACSPLFDDRNGYIGAIAVVRDVTKLIELRKKYQNFLKEQPSRSTDMKVICANCKSVKDGSKWVQVEDFFVDMVFSHGICPVCCDKLYPDLNLNRVDENDFDV
ncbi:response regulator [Desulfospira joergensenii]|uniref:response regulator n=1 Tax=Desulfospira joergensenii TaxID=53329 RepID=UPI0004250B90|nr:response regulator [Desulfospira joergensenii]